HVGNRLGSHQHPVGSPRNRETMSAQFLGNAGPPVREFAVGCAAGAAGAVVDCRTDETVSVGRQTLAERCASSLGVGSRGFAFVGAYGSPLLHTGSFAISYGDGCIDHRSAATSFSSA